MNKNLLVSEQILTLHKANKAFMQTALLTVHMNHACSKPGETTNNIRQ